LRRQHVRGQGYEEGRPFPLTFAVRADFSAVKFDQLLHDGKPQAQSAVTARGRCVRLAKAVEHIREEVGADALARIGYRDLDPILRARHLQGDLASFGGEFDRVAQQVPDHLLQAIGIGVDAQALDRVDLGFDRDVLGVGCGADRIERKIDDLPEAFRAVFVLREVEEMTVDEVAACLEVPAATVRTRLFRAKARLRESIAREIDVAAQDVFGFAGARCDRIVARVLARIDAPPSADPAASS